MLSLHGNPEAMLQWEAKVLQLFAWAIITLTHHVLGKCRQYSAAQRHDGWCVCRHSWTVDPIISWGRKGGASHHGGEIRDDWLNQNRGPSWMAACWHYWGATVGVNATAQWQQRAVKRSKKIKCVTIQKWGGRGLYTVWRRKLPVIKNISWIHLDASPAKIRWYKPTQRNTSILQLVDRISKTEIHPHRQRHSHTHSHAHCTSANSNSQMVTDTTAVARNAERTNTLHSN